MMTSTKLPTNTWIQASWEQYIEAIQDPAYETKGYERWAAKRRRT